MINKHNPIYTFSQIIRSSSNSERVNHTLYNDGGESEILVDVDINTRNTFECRVMLLDEQVCSKRFSVVFEGNVSCVNDLSHTTHCILQ